MYTTLLVLPFVGSILAGFLGRKVGTTGAQLISTTCMCISAILAIVAFYEVALAGSPVIIDVGSWIDSELLVVNWSFMFDSLTVSMLLAVLVVSSLVHVFSISYMAEDPHQQRFFAYLSMFTGFMVLLVTGDNYFVLFLGWEGIGVSSYLLVGFWFTRMQANKSAIKALTVNRVGDMFLSVGFFALFWVFGNLDYATIFSLSPYINETILSIIGILLLLAAIGKSAQLGLHTWLPDAIEGYWNWIISVGLIIILTYAFIMDYATSILYIEDYTVLHWCVVPLLTPGKDSKIQPSSDDSVQLPLSLSELPTNVLSVLTGTMLGDGSIRYSNFRRDGRASGNPRFEISMSTFALPYIQYLITVLNTFVGCSALRPWPNPTNPKHTGKLPTQYNFNSHTHIVFAALHQLWYRWDDSNNRFERAVPSLELLTLMFTAEALAHWIMQDGYGEWAKSNYILLFCTESFTRADCEVLVRLFHTLGIIATLKRRNAEKDRYRIRISSHSIKNVRELVAPYMIAQFMYKIDPNASKIG